MEHRRKQSSLLACFKKRTQLERRLIIASGIVSIVALALIIIAIIIQSDKIHKIDSSASDVCTTPACIQTAAKVFEYADLNADPCDDFYRFACGNFAKKPIPEDQTKISPFQDIGKRVTEQLKGLVDEPLGPDAPRAHRLFQKLYKTCMNTTAIEQKGLNKAKYWIRELGGWPLLEGDRWNENQFDWKSFAFKVKKFGVIGNSVLGFRITIDSKNSSKYVIALSGGLLPLARNILLNDEYKSILKAYMDCAIDIAVIFGADRNRATRELMQVKDFMRKLAEINPSVEEMRKIEDLYNPITIQELQQTYPRFHWLNYFRAAVGNPTINITDQEIIIVSWPKYLSGLLDLLESTPKRIVANFLLATSVEAMLPFLTEEIRNRVFEYNKVVSGMSEKVPRWKRCLWSTSGLYLAMGSMYVRKYFNEDIKRDVEAIILDVRREFSKVLREIDWMDAATRKHAQDKLSKMTMVVAYPNELLQDELLQDYYEKLDFPSDDYLENMMQLDLFFKDRAIEKLRRSPNEYVWMDLARPTMVNAMYFSNYNRIVITAAFLQGIFYGQHRPKYMNYGSIGSTIGHEITHGFDDQGRHFDKDGNMKDWWKEETLEAFQEKAQCIIDQYGNYTVPEVEININGIVTQGENIADNGGIIQGYLAYQTWVERNGEEPKLPGLQKYTQNQMFWVSAAHVECQKIRKETLKLQLDIGAPHSPGMFRVIGPFGNTEYFAKDFNCPKGSTMNPEKKCRVW